MNQNVPQYNIAEWAAQTVEKAPELLTVDVIHDIIIQNHASPDVAAKEIVEGIKPLFEYLAAEIRKQPIQEIEAVLSKRDKHIHDLALDRVKQAAYSLVKNPAVKPRKRPGMLRKGIWYQDMLDKIEDLRQVPNYEDTMLAVFESGFKKAVAQIAQKLRNTKATFDPGDGTGIRVRQPNDYADLVEKEKL